MNGYVGTNPLPIAEPDEQRASPLAGLSFCCWGGAILLFSVLMFAGGSVSVEQQMRNWIYSCLVYAPLLALGVVLGVRSLKSPGTRSAIALTSILLNVFTFFPAALVFAMAAIWFLLALFE